MRKVLLSTLESMKSNKVYLETRKITIKYFYKYQKVLWKVKTVWKLNLFYFINIKNT